MNSLKRINRRAKKIVPLLILIITVLLVNNLLIIRKVNCTINNEICPKEAQIVINKLLGTNSLLINRKELLTFIKAVYPVDEMILGYKSVNTINIALKSHGPYIEANVYLVKNLPLLSMDQSPNTTDSASWWVKPTKELENYLFSQKALGFTLWDNGLMTSIATTGADVSFIFTEKPAPETVSSIYRIVNVVHKYLDVSKIYIAGKRCFLSRSGQPDIIVSVPIDEDNLILALQSINYLTTIKKDTKVIDFSFKNPIIR